MATSALAATTTGPVADAASAEALACPAGTMGWQREEDFTLCAGLCHDDADCLPEERCAALDFGPPVDGSTIAFEDVEMPDGKVALGLCDPFWQDNPNVISPDEPAADVAATVAVP